MSLHLDVSHFCSWPQESFGEAFGGESKPTGATATRAGCPIFQQKNMDSRRLRDEDFLARKTAE